MKAEEPCVAPVPALGPWSPSAIQRVYRVVKTGTRPFHVLTDAGPAYVKALGNPEGPHALVCELIGTCLAAWLGLPTFHYAILQFPSELRAVFPSGEPVIPGPAFAARAVNGRSWSGEAADLVHVRNIDAVAGLIVLDTWLRNHDRCFDFEFGGEKRRNYRNVFFSSEAAPHGRYTLLAIDHTSCLRRTSELSVKLRHLDSVRDASIYGLFEDFRPVVQRAHVQQFAARLRTFTRSIATSVVALVPDAWDLSGSRREAIVDFLSERARFVGSSIESWLASEVGWRDS